MKPINSFAVASAQISTHGGLVLKLEATSNANITAGLFLQIHDSAATPTEGAVPLKVWPAAECGYKEFKRGELLLGLGCYVCLSTTAATKTLATGGSNILDILDVELSDPDQLASTTFVGDLTSAVTGLQVWAEAAGPKKLISLEVDGTSLTTVCYVQLFAIDNPVNGAVPVGQYTIAATAVRTGQNAWRFGEMGRDVFSQDAALTKHVGCTVKISTTPGLLTLTGDTAKIKAEYR